MSSNDLFELLQSSHLENLTEALNNEGFQFVEDLCYLTAEILCKLNATVIQRKKLSDIALKVVEKSEKINKIKKENEEIDFFNLKINNFKILLDEGKIDQEDYDSIRKKLIRNTFLLETSNNVCFIIFLFVHCVLIFRLSIGSR
jgi:hypothetical protein